MTESTVAKSALYKTINQNIAGSGNTLKLFTVNSDFNIDVYITATINNNKLLISAQISGNNTNPNITILNSTIPDGITITFNKKDINSNNTVYYVCASTGVFSKAVIKKSINMYGNTNDFPDLTSGYENVSGLRDIGSITNVYTHTFTGNTQFNNNVNFNSVTTGTDITITVSGNITVNNMQAGSANVTNTLTAGSAEITNELTAGSANVTGMLTAKSSAEITGELTAGSANVTGMLTAKSSAEITNNLKAGSANVTNTLTAGSANIENAVNAANAEIEDTLKTDTLNVRNLGINKHSNTSSITLGTGDNEHIIDGLLTQTIMRLSNTKTGNSNGYTFYADADITNMQVWLGFDIISAIHGLVNSSDTISLTSYSIDSDGNNNETKLTYDSFNNKVTLFSASSGNIIFNVYVQPKTGTDGVYEMYLDVNNNGDIKTHILVASNEIGSFIYYIHQYSLTYSNLSNLHINTLVFYKTKTSEEPVIKILSIDTAAMSSDNKTINNMLVTADAFVQMLNYVTSGTSANVNNIAKPSLNKQSFLYQDGQYKTIAVSETDSGYSTSGEYGLYDDYNSTNKTHSISAKKVHTFTSETLNINENNRQYTFNLQDKISNPGTYGPSAAVDVGTSAGNNKKTINVPQLSVDKHGRVTSIGEKTLTLYNNVYNGTNGTIVLNGNVFTLAPSGVTAGTYGPSAAVDVGTSAGSNNSNSIVIPQLKVDTYGRVTSVTSRTLNLNNTTYNGTDKNISVNNNTINLIATLSNGATAGHYA